MTYLTAPLKHAHKKKDFSCQVELLDNYLHRQANQDVKRKLTACFVLANEDNIIKGCQSKVWVHADMNDNKIAFTADSDAIITKGIIAILIRAFSNQHPTAILEANTDFIDKIGLKEHLSPTRANGLVSMIKQLKMYAIAYQTQLN